MSRRQEPQSPSSWQRQQGPSSGAPEGSEALGRLDLALPAPEPRGWLPAVLSPSQPPSPCRGVFAVTTGHQHPLLMPPHRGMFSSVAQSCLTLCDPRTTARQASLSITNSRSSLKLISIELVMPSNHLILCHPLLLLPSIFLIIKVFSNESVLHIRW